MVYQSSKMIKIYSVQSLSKVLGVLPHNAIAWLAIDDQKSPEITLKSKWLKTVGPHLFYDS